MTTEPLTGQSDLELGQPDKTRPTLLLRVKDHKDHESWQEFDDLYRPLLTNFVRKRSGLKNNVIDDIVQEILVKLANGMPNFEYSKDKTKKFRTYLWVVASHGIVDWIRKNKKHEKISSIYDPEGNALQIAEKNSDEPDDEFISEVQKNAKSAAMAFVKNNETEENWYCFEEHKLKGRKAKDVAEELNIELGALYTRVSRVFKRFKEKCAEYMESLGDENE